MNIEGLIVGYGPVGAAIIIVAFVSFRGWLESLRKGASEQATTTSSDAELRLWMMEHVVTPIHRIERTVSDIKDTVEDIKG